MDDLLKAIADILREAATGQVSASFLVLSLIGNAAQIWFGRQRESWFDSESNRLNAQINAEIKSGIALAEDFRKSYETKSETETKFYEQIIAAKTTRGRGN